MAIITIGGQQLEVPKLNFKALKKIYPITQKMKGLSKEDLLADPSLGMKAIDDTLELISVALQRSETPMSVDELEEALEADELPGLQRALMDILSENGLGGTPSGEPLPVAVPTAKTKPSTGTSTRSSAKSSRA